MGNGPATVQGPIGMDQGEVTGMFGIGDPQIIIGYGLALALGLVCIIYGIKKWNEGGDADG